MDPQLAAVVIISMKDLIIELTKPKEELPDEWKAKVEAQLQISADEGEAWLKNTLAKMKGTANV